MPPIRPLSLFFTFYHSFDSKVLVGLVCIESLLCAEPLTGAFIQVPSCHPLRMDKPASTTRRPGHFQAPVRGQVKKQRAERDQE